MRGVGAVRYAGIHVEKPIVERFLTTVFLVGTEALGCKVTRFHVPGRPAAAVGGWYEVIKLGIIKVPLDPDHD